MSNLLEMCVKYTNVQRPPEYTNPYTTHTNTHQPNHTLYLTVRLWLLHLIKIIRALVYRKEEWRVRGCAYVSKHVLVCVEVLYTVLVLQVLMDAVFSTITALSFIIRVMTSASASHDGERLFTIVYNAHFKMKKCLC